MPTVNGTITGPGGVPADPGQRLVTITLVDLAGRARIGYSSSDSEVVGSTEVTAGADGSWSAVLTANSAVSTDWGDSLYRVEAGYDPDLRQPYTYYISVPSGGGPYWAGDVRVALAGSAPVEYAGYLPLSGGTLTGPLTLSGAPSSNLHAATKAYVDSAAGSATVADGAITSAKIANGAIVNEDINASAGIALSKLATDPLARASHTGTQTASTISNFDTQVRTSRLDQMAAPTAAVPLNSQKVTGLANGTNSGDAVNKSQLDGKLSLSGGTLSGALTLPSDPTVDLHAATKAYVDSTASSGVGDGAVTTVKLADGAVTSEKIADGTIAFSKLDPAGGALTGSLELVSTDDGGLDTTDSTSRLILNSYQAGGNNWGEVIRVRLRPQTGDVVENRAKGMIAWQMPEDLDVDADYHSVTWIGAHWGAQDADDAGDVHAHWSIETPDALGRLQTRFALSLADEAGTFGADKTLITTSSADMVIGCDSGQVLRLKSGPSTSAMVETAKTVWGTGSARWRFGMNGDAESSGGAGSNWAATQTREPAWTVRSRSPAPMGG
jgi:hypothetical protein